LNEPDRAWKLPGVLAEISGISFIDNHKIACVQDEKGIIYIFDLDKGNITAQTRFGEDGDYEDIAIIEKDAWILRSDGTLYQVMDYPGKEEVDGIEYPTFLNSANDTEGLAFDASGNNLVIACKGLPFPDDRDMERMKAVYRFDLATRHLDTKPFLLVELDSVRHYRSLHTTLPGTGPDLQGERDTFQPSGIAIHPLTGDFYILASAGKMLLVLSRKGETLAMVNLRPKRFPQPEGICFSRDGILYISNEGKGREGTILEFVPVGK
jgi:hypothetical protein